MTLTRTKSLLIRCHPFLIVNCPLVETLKKIECPKPLNKVPNFVCAHVFFPWGAWKAIFANAQ